MRLEFAMPFSKLVRHPSRSSAPAIEIAAMAVALPTGAVSFHYRVFGDVACIRVPPAGVSARTDNLWRHTCFEAFVDFKDPGRPDRYVELNFAPSTAWGAYVFEGYRHGMRPWRGIDTPVTQCRVDSDSIVLQATVPGLSLEFDSTLGLAAVIEDVEGAVSHWALTHPHTTPDFHAAAGWTGTLQPSSVEDQA